MMGSVRNLHIVLLIGLMCVLQGMALVCPYTDKACSCDGEHVSCTRLSKIPPLNMGPTVIPVKHVSFINGNITTISITSLPPGLRSIYLQDNPLTNIFANALISSGATLESLHISQSKLHSLSPVLQNLTNLTSLSIDDTVLHDWDTSLLKQMSSSLRFLKLNKVGLTSWPSWMSYFHLLREMEMSGNSLKDIPDDGFISLNDSLEKLYLVNTGLTYIPQTLLKLSKLINLDLSENHFLDGTEIEKIIGSTFAQTMHTLRLQAVRLDKIANFSKLTSLKIINLSRNKISDVPAGSLPLDLTELDLLGNRLRSVPQDVRKMSNMFYLDLSRNQITDITANSFPPRLAYLDLSYNNLTVISNITFQYLTFLATLNLNFNPILTISPGAFSDLVFLRMVYIIYTSLTEIPLALTKLNSETKVFLTNSKPLACQCPTPKELVKWFSSLVSHLDIQGSCNNGQSVGSYLSGKCGNSTAG